MNTKGLWVVIEGIDGAGKTSAVKTIQKVFEDQGLEIEVYREPGGTILGEHIRQLLKTEHLSIFPLAEVLLFYAARVQLLKTLIEPKRSEGKSIILDRFELSTFAYQAGGRGVDSAIIQEISAICVGGQKPDLTVFLSVKPKLAYERVRSRGAQDAIEKQSIHFFENVALAYEMFLDSYPNVLEIDANQDFESVQLSIYQSVSAWLRSRLK
jgi:dTMP kinase